MNGFYVFACCLVVHHEPYGYYSSCYHDFVQLATRKGNKIKYSGYRRYDIFQISSCLIALSFSYLQYTTSQGAMIPNQEMVQMAILFYPTNKGGDA